MKGMPSMDLATALAGSPVHVRGAQQGGRARADSGTSDGGDFGSVLSDAVSQEAASAAAPTPDAPSAVVPPTPDAPSAVVPPTPNVPSAVGLFVPVAGAETTTDASQGSLSVDAPSDASTADSASASDSTLNAFAALGLVNSGAVGSAAGNPDGAATPAGAVTAKAVTSPATVLTGTSPSSDLPPFAPAGSSSAPAVQTAPTTAVTAAAASLPAAAPAAGTPAAFAAVPTGVQAAPSGPDAATTPAGAKAGPDAPAGVPAPAVALTATSAANINGSSAPTATPTGVVRDGVVGVNKAAGLTARAADAVPVAATPADGLGAAGAAALAAPGPATAPVPPGPATPATPAPPAASPQPALTPQLAKPLFTLAAAPHGQHIMTLKVTPEDLGPLTVRAHIDGAGVRIELFAPGDTGREALRGILPELRKELADAGFGATLDLSDHSGPAGRGQDAGGDAGQGAAGREASEAGSGSGSGPGGRNGPGEPRPGHRWDALADQASLRSTSILNGPQTTLDILV